MKKHLKFGRPDRWEVLCIILYGLFFYLFNDIVNMMSSSPDGWEALGTPISGIKISMIGLLWVSFLLFHIFLFIIIGRSIWKRGTTHHYLDLVAGILVVAGVFLLLIPTIVMLMGKSPDWVMPWFFNLGRITVYHIGVVIQVIGMIYFAVTK
jgi:hypothetical protein